MKGNVKLIDAAVQGDLAMLIGELEEVTMGKRARPSIFTLARA